MNPSIDPDAVVGVIDHHALQSKTIVTVSLLDLYYKLGVLFRVI